ncbi:MAG: c-type cytochrome [Candidatus Aminicenantes bacterium]|nr:c-type cytochrome [Candidatus Aminicenantes bacterium]NIM79321.1 c-type cytochrome [Candidatus Aminicenantes bacterium]NIN18598.1 c-type cytochrome [Candidatus Aminicenantes bacterium]NIN42487.1 c-type cytochrome [Candidatus Aminicenantes bacterium]NIN85253.1 c-type cytochrome [Candidatus Aminicenantes bacterium]
MKIKIKNKNKKQYPPRQKKPIHCGIRLVLAVILILGFYTPGVGEKPKKEVNLEGIPANPLSGRIVFEKKGCIDCHSIDVFLEKTGPDLGREKVFGSFYDLGSRLWNHAPRMAVQTDFLKKEWPTMSIDELNKLISYLFFLRYLGEPGDAARGKKLLKSKTCLNCHRIGKEGASRGISLDQLTEYASPLYTAQVIWNHGPAMKKEMTARGIKPPTFGDKDITDISAYLREYSRGQFAKRRYMSPGNPKTGATLFEEKGCSKCHSILPDQPSKGAQLDKMKLHRSVTAIAAAMWNHGDIMERLIEEEKIPWPEFAGSEMADLIAFLYFYDYYGRPGNPGKGKQVFQAKSCIKCHGPDHPLTMERPDLFATPTGLVSTMWNHVPYMHELTVTKNIDWPKLSETGLRDLYAYLVDWWQKDENKKK